MASRALVSYIKFGKLLLIVPYGISRCTRTGLYVCQPSSLVFQCFALSVHVAANMVMFLHDVVGNRNLLSPLRRSVYAVFTTHVCVGIVKIWRSGKLFACTFNKIERLQGLMKSADVSLLPSKPLFLATGLAMTFVVVYAVIESCFYYAEFHRGLDAGIQKYSPSAYNILYGGSNCSYLGRDENGCEIPLEVIALSIASVISEAFNLLSACYINALCFVHVTVLLYFANSLLEHMKKSANNGAGSSAMIQVANEMLSLSGTIEEGIGVIVLSVCLALIPFYSLGMQYILNHDDDSRSVKHVIGSTVYVIILIAAAETNSRMKTIGSEMAAMVSASKVDPLKITGMTVTEFDQSDRENVIILLQRISSNEFGLRGKAFTVTYGLVGSVAGLVATYSIIIYQFQGF